MALATYHTGPRGFWGFMITSVLGNRGVIPAMVATDADGNTTPAGTVADPISVTAGAGSGSIATNQIAVASTAGGTLIVAARATRRTVVVENSGTTDVWIGVTGLTSANGFLLPGVKGAMVSLDTAAAIYGIVSAASQTVSYIETF